MLHPTGFTGSAEPRSSSSCEALPEGALAISDDPGIVWRAGRRTTADLVDASILRIQTGDLTAASLAAVAAQADVCAVVVRSAARWGSFDDLPDRLAAAGYEVADATTAAVALYVRARLRRRCDAELRRLERSAAEAVEVAQAGGGVDDLGEGHPLGRQVEDHEHDEDDRAHRPARLEHHARPSTAPSRLAPVSPSISRSPQVGAEQAGRRAHHRTRARGRPVTCRPPARCGT